MRLAVTALCTLTIGLFSAAGYAQQDVEKITADFEKPMGDKADPKHTPNIEVAASVTAGEWFPVKISIGHQAQHPSLVEHFVRWIALEADGVEINRVYLHPVMAKPEVTFMIALPDTRTFDKDGNVTARKDKTVTLRAVEMPTHASQFWAEKKVTVKAAAAKPASTPTPAPKK
jgi:desulfoferrodoxin-like iron-binding protein